jgi:hypothetical protein
MLAGGVATVAASSGPDAPLLRLGAEFDRLHAAWLLTHAEVERLEGPFEQEWGQRGAIARRQCCRVGSPSEESILAKPWHSTPRARTPNFEPLSI